MEKQELTVEEVLVKTANILSNLKIPAALASEIGLPIEGCIKNIQLCLGAIEEQKKKAGQLADTMKEMEEADDGREADPE